MLCEDWPEKCHAPGSGLGTTVLCEPAQSKCTWTLQNSHFMRECKGKIPRLRTGTKGILCENVYTVKKMPRPRTRTTVLREPARSKFASHLCQNLQQKMSRSLWARAIEMHLDISQAPVCARICSRTSGAPWSNPGLKIYRKNPSVCTPGMCSNAGDVAGCLQNIGRRQQCNVLLRC